MLFRTELYLQPTDYKIKHDQLILLLGSCFSQNIGERLQNYKFKSISNPFGTIFHPIALGKLLNYVTQNEQVHAEQLLLSQGIYVHPDFHSSLGDIDQIKALFNINNTISSIHHLLKDIKYLFITLGTTIGYRLKSNENIVANCHKLPLDIFNKEDVSVSECSKSLSLAIEQLLQINSQIKIIFTVSPVRHIKDGIIANARSKAKLMSLAENLEAQYEQVTYFPAYEIMMDDLRDYRYYEKDMIHPNDLAIDYIWEKFCTQYFDENTIQIMQKIEKINRAVSHRPFNPSSKEHIAFLAKVEEDKINLMQMYPWIKL
jgi:hypothetical protein